VGRNSNLLLNVPPDRTGRINANDSIRLMEFRKAREESFSKDLIEGAEIKASNVRDNAAQYSVANLLDDNYNTYWATDDSELNPSIEIDLKQAKTFNRLALQEYIPLGQRVASFSVKYWDNGGWKDLTDATTMAINAFCVSLRSLLKN
jgi:Alpha-L-fucosidase